MKLWMSLLAIALALSLSACGSARPVSDRGPGAAAQQQALYRCPMHPDVTSTSPGTCPKCGMALQKVPARPGMTAEPDTGSGGQQTPM
jgi:Cu+-exporting ATPase